MPQLHAGVARCDITPPIGIAQGNWSAQFHERSEGIDLPLMCTALAIADGTETVIIAEWDLLYPPSGAWLAEVRSSLGWREPGLEWRWRRTPSRREGPVPSSQLPEPASRSPAPQVPLHEQPGRRGSWPAGAAYR